MNNILNQMMMKFLAPDPQGYEAEQHFNNLLKCFVWASLRSHKYHGQSIRLRPSWRFSYWQLKIGNYLQISLRINHLEFAAQVPQWVWNDYCQSFGVSPKEWLDLYNPIPF